MKTICACVGVAQTAEAARTMQAAKTLLTGARRRGDAPVLQETGAIPPSLCAPCSRSPSAAMGASCAKRSLQNPTRWRAIPRSENGFRIEMAPETVIRRRRVVLSSQSPAQSEHDAGFARETGTLQLMPGRKAAPHRITPVDRSSHRSPSAYFRKIRSYHNPQQTIRFYWETVTARPHWYF